MVWYEENLFLSRCGLVLEPCIFVLVTLIRLVPLAVVIILLYPVIS